MPVIRRKDKAAWGFTQDAEGNIVVGVENTDDGDDMLSTSDNSEARGNGGGFPAEDAVTYEYLQPLTLKEMKALAQAHGITLDKKSAKDVREELVEYYEVEPATEE